jgi:subtilisin family serine protease
MGFLPGSRASTRQPDFEPAAMPDQVIVRLRPSFYGLNDAVLEARLGGSILRRMPEFESVLLGLEAGEAPAAIERLNRLPQVARAEPNYLVHSLAVPNDPYYAVQSPYLSQIGAPAAWDIELGDSAVLVAVLDTGIDLEHPDLQGRFWLNPLEIPGNGIDDDENGCVDDLHGCSFVSTPAEGCPSTMHNVPRDDNGHGTLVAGIIAAQGNNNLGVSGAAPGVTILPVKIFDCLGNGTIADATQGLMYAVRNGARVANISFGTEGESATLANAVREAYSHYGVILISGTGNEGGSSILFPARLPDVFAVASSGSGSDANARSPFSNWGKEVDIASPGLNIVSTVPGEFCHRGAWICIEGEPYAVASGTSFAVPLVSALAALIVSQTPNLPPEAVLQIIARTAEPLLPGDTPGWYGAGRIRMREALNQRRFYIGVSGIAKEE